jgi:hypothetical protein
MPVSITITGNEAEEQEVQAPPEPQGVKIEIVEKDRINFKLMTRSAINGDHYDP